MRKDLQKLIVWFEDANFYLPRSNYSGMPNWSKEVTISICSDVLIISSSSLVALTPVVEAFAPLLV